jgi:hypothetical protein
MRGTLRSAVGDSLALTLLALGLLPALLQGDNRPVSPQDKRSLNKVGIVFPAHVPILCRVSLPVSSAAFNTFPIYLAGPYRSTGLALGSAISDGISAGLAQARAELALELRLNREITEILGEWRLRRVLWEAFLHTLKQGSAFGVEEIKQPFDSKDIKKTVAALSNRNLDAILLVELERYGLQSQREGFAVFLKVKVEVLSIKTGKTIASGKFQYDTAFGQLEPQTSNAVLKAVPVDPNFRLPTSLAPYERFTQDGGRLLKRDLKLAAQLLSQASLTNLGIVEGASTDWRKYCRRRPDDWTAIK